MHLFNKQQSFVLSKLAILSIVLPLIWTVPVKYSVSECEAARNRTEKINQLYKKGEYQAATETLLNKAFHSLLNDTDTDTDDLPPICLSNVPAQCHDMYCFEFRLLGDDMLLSKTSSLQDWIRIPKDTVHCMSLWTSVTLEICGKDVEIYLPTSITSNATPS